MKTPDQILSAAEFAARENQRMVDLQGQPIPNSQFYPISPKDFQALIEMAKSNQLILSEPKNYPTDVLRDAQMHIESFYIDWARFQPGPDHDPSYKPEFPEIVVRIQNLINELQSAAKRVEELEKALIDKTAESALWESTAKLVSKLPCGHPNDCGYDVKGDGTWSRIGCIWCERDASMKELQSTREDVKDAMELLRKINEQLESPSRNTTVTSYRRDGSVIISSDIRQEVKAILETPTAKRVME